MKRKETHVRVATASVIDLRKALIESREREKEYKLNAYRMSAQILRLRQEKKDIRAEKNIRYDKLRWKLFKKSQQVYVLKGIIHHRHRLPKKRIQKKSYRAGYNKAYTTAKDKWLNKGLEKGRSLGYRIGIKEGKEAKATDLFYRGVEAGKRRIKKQLDHIYNFRRKMIYRIESVSRVSTMMNRLSKILGLSLNVISFLFWCSQHEYWTKQDLDRAFDDIGFDGYYTCVAKLKSLGMMEALKKDRVMITWRLTYKGKVLTTKMNAYLNKHFNKKTNK